MNTDTGEIRSFVLDSLRDREEQVREQLEALNRAERRADGTGPWVEVSPRVAAIVKAGHGAMKAKKQRRKAAAAARRRNRG